MFKIPDSRLSASNSAVLASENFLVPITIRSVARSSQAAFEGLQQAYEEVKEFGPALAKTVPGVSLIGFEDLLSPRLSRVEVLLRGKEYQFDLTFAFRCPIPKERDFWARIQLVAAAYDHLAKLVAAFEDRKGIDLYLEEARLDQQKEDPDSLRTFRK